MMPQIMGTVMAGKFSRDKGRRGEQQLVLSLVGKGYKAERILRQYQFGGQPDVKTTYPQEYTFELKCRKSAFKTIYDLYTAERDHEGVLAIIWNGKPIAIASYFEKLLSSDRSFRAFTPEHPKKKTLNRIAKLEEQKQTADFLVLKDNGKYRLYLRYW